MTQDPCDSARQESIKADEQLQAHLQDPMNWKGEHLEEFNDKKKQLEAEVAQKKKALEDCEASK